MASAEQYGIGRLRYWQGQTLSSGDFRSEARANEVKRSLHNRALHDVPGVGWGLAVSVKSAAPLVLTVACGLAYDCAGRTLLLQSARDIAAPKGPAWLMIRLRKETKETRGCPPVDAGCVPEGQGRVDSLVELAWLEEDVRADGAVLARINAAGLDPAFQPRMIRPMARPRMARGETIAGNTPWERWEIYETDGRGGLRKKAVGMQTHIDTSAAGFTATPNYFATLEGGEWDAARAEFAPIFFPQVAEPSVDGFTFRLMMAETTRRRHRTAFATGRVKDASAVAAQGRQIAVEDASVFRKGDAVALLRPRGDAANLITANTGKKLTLTVPLPVDVEPNTTVLAIGNLPRTSAVLESSAASVAMLATVAAPVTLKRKSILVRLSDRTVTVVSGISAGKLKVAEPFTGWRKEDPAGYSQVTEGVSIKTMSAVTGATRIILNKADHNIDQNLFAVCLDEQNHPLGIAAHVEVRTGDTITVSPQLTAAVAAQVKRVAVVHTDLTVLDLQPLDAAVVVKVKSVAPFREGDFVAVAGDHTTVATIRKIEEGASKLTLEGPIAAPVGAILVAANWLGATQVDQPVVPAEPSTITVGRADAVPPGAFVAVRGDDGFGAVAAVKTSQGTAVTLSAALPGLSALDTLAVGAFPAIVTVVVQDENQLRFAEAGALSAGDVLVSLDEVASGLAPLLVVESAEGTLATLRTTPATLAPGAKLGVVHFSDTVIYKSTDAGDATVVTVDRDWDVRGGDFVSVLTHYHDNSTTGFVQDVQGNNLILFPASFAGDGIVPRDWIDGGILGPAAVSLTPFQPFVRMESADGLNPSRPATAYGLDLVTGKYVSSQVYTYVWDAAGGHVYLWPAEGGALPRYRPETLALFTTFNPDFASAFATFAQKQKLAVSWVGCQREFTVTRECPGTRPVVGDACAMEKEK